MKLTMIAGLTALALAGCAAGPDYVKPDTAPLTPAAFPSSAGDGTALDTSAPPAGWWRQFEDPQLDALVEQAWRGNYDLRIAMARLQIAAEQLTATKSAGLPSLGVDAGVARKHSAKVERSDGDPVITSPAKVSAFIDWELDLFGRVRRSVEAARAGYEQQQALRDDVRRTLLAQVVIAYAEFRSAQDEAACLKQQLENYGQALELVRERERVGKALAVDRIRVETKLGLLAARAPGIAARQRVARNHLATLSGLKLDAPEVLALEAPHPLRLPATLAVDDPAAMLRRRPDVAAAERNLAAATAQQGVAVAELFPRVSLSGMFGLVAPAGSLHGADARAWQVGGALSWTLLDGGALRARVRAAGAGAQIALAGYEKTVAGALEEADSALSDWRQFRARDVQLTSVYELARETARLTRLRYRNGAESVLGLLDAEYAVLTVEEQLIGVHRDIAVATARSYVALAGGLDGGGKSTAN
ncbi:efflux transporter outer membrane subunit [Pseudoduganella violaceinigra]|uniref:efflux transporter outer membrane subunit n=1 Tax=Pseudoduganella violaceinigra TaxID=246602 RepID=UPI000A06C181|nr:TolC family protein [Pseudoduganella violaceinigra]